MKLLKGDDAIWPGEGWLLRLAVAVRRWLVAIACMLTVSVAWAEVFETDQGAIDWVHEDGALVIWDTVHELPSLLMFNGVQSSRDFVLSRLESGMRITYVVRISSDGNRVITEIIRE